MSGWLLIWILFIAGFLPLGCGIYLLTNAKYRKQKEQRRAGIAFAAIGLAMLFPFLWVWIPLLL